MLKKYLSFDSPKCDSYLLFCQESEESEHAASNTADATAYK